MIMQYDYGCLHFANMTKHASKNDYCEFLLHSPYSPGSTIAVYYIIWSSSLIRVLFRSIRVWSLKHDLMNIPSEILISSIIDLLDYKCIVGRIL